MATKTTKKANTKKPVTKPSSKKVVKVSSVKATKPASKPSKKSSPKPLAKKAALKPATKSKLSAKVISKPTSAKKNKPATAPIKSSGKSAPSKKPVITVKSKAVSNAKIKSIPTKKAAVPAVSTKVIKPRQNPKPASAPTITVPVAKPENKKPVNKPLLKNEAPPATTNGKTRYNDQDLVEFKKVIDDKLDHARKELTYLQEQIVEMNENNADIQGSDWFDDSSIHAEVELLNNMAIRQRQFIQNLENALIRIENKSYGICTITGTLIDKKRLMLVPHATKSIEAKHIEQATMVPVLNQVAPDERVLRRSAEGKAAKKAGSKKAKGKSSRDYDEEDGDETVESNSEDLDIGFAGGDD